MSLPVISIIFLVLGISWGEAQIHVPPTDGTISVDFTMISASGKGKHMVGNFELKNGIGTLEFNNKSYDVVCYTYQDWIAAGYFLYDLIGVATDGSEVGVFYIYANLSSITIDYIYYESYDVLMNGETATGLVDFKNESSKIDVVLPGLNTLPTPLKTGLTIQGPQITLQYNQGSLTCENNTYNIIIFNVVNCGDCGGGGWYELHCMFVPNDKEACFGILYLTFDDHNTVTLTYTFCLPNLASPNCGFDAVWSGSLNGTRISL